MRYRPKKILKMLLVMVLMISMCTVTVFGASTAKATNKVRFRTAVINKLHIAPGASAEVVRGGETLQAFEGMRLDSGDTVRTVGDAMLYILVDQNKIVRLGNDTEVVLDNTLLGTRVKMTLVRGSMFFNVIEKLPEDESLQFVYGNITISVRGTSGPIEAKDGTAVMMLTDGKVEISELLPNGETVSTPINAGQKFEYAEGNSATGARSASKVSSFTLSELPRSVIEEMKNDPSLKERIVNNVPVSNGPSGPVYTTPDQVDLDVVSIAKGEDSMEPSPEIAKTALENREGVVPEQKNEDDGNSQEGPGTEQPGEDPEGPGKDPEDPGEDPEGPGEDPEGPGEDPEGPGEDPEDPGEDPEDPGEDPEDPGEDPEGPGEDPNDPGEDPEGPGEDPEGPGKDPEDPGEDPEGPGEDPGKPGGGTGESVDDPEPPTPPTPQEPKVKCPNCQQEFTVAEYQQHVLPCKHTVCQEEFESHDLLPCGDHFACGVEEEDEYKHQLIEQSGETICNSPDKWTYCAHCEQYILVEEFDGDEHGLASCGEHYRCMDGFDPDEHDEPLDCGHYLCDEKDHGERDCGCGLPGCSDDPAWFGHGEIISVGCGHYTCVNIMHWREHIAVERLRSKTREQTYLCQADPDDILICPLCGKRVSAEDLADENGEHMQYDEAEQCMTCDGEAWPSAKFRRIFMDRRFDTGVDLDTILSTYLHITLRNDPAPE